MLMRIKKGFMFLYVICQLPNFMEYHGAEIKTHCIANKAKHN